MVIFNRSLIYVSVNKPRMSSRGYFELTTLDDTLTKKICADKCGSRCCNVKISEHYVPIDIIDYANLEKLGLQHMVSYYSSVEKPQLLSQYNGDCVFVQSSTRLCQIYPFRPKACRKYPFPSYTDEQVKPPKWCDLFHYSTENLVNERIQINLKADEIELKLVKTLKPEITLEYFRKERNRSIITKDEFFEERRLSQNEILWIFEFNDIDMEEILDIVIKNLKTSGNLENKNVFRILFYNGVFQKIGIMYGAGIDHFRDKITDPIKMVNKDDIIHLLNLCKSNDEYSNTYLDGVYFVEDISPFLISKISENTSISFEYL